MNRAKRILSASRHVSVSELPNEKQLGQTVFKGGVIYIYANFGGITTWYPLNRPQSSYIHNQGEARLVWTVRHNLGSKDVLVGTYDNQNNLMEGSVQHVEDSETGEWYTTITFTTAVTGYAVVFGRENLSADSISATNLDVSGTLTVGNNPVALESQVDAVTTALGTKLGTGETAYNSQRLGGVLASDYITVNDTIDLGEV